MRKSNPVRLLLLVALAALPAAPQRAGTSATPVHIRTAQELENAFDRVDRIFAAEFAKDNLAGATIGIISGPDLVWTKSYGMADAENKVAATKESVYRIGSITKQFTGIMLLQLVSQGKVKLSDPVAKYYPEIAKVANPWKGAPPITLLELATHTSGMDREPDDMATYTTGPVANWQETLLSALPHTKFAFEPGTRYFYSNIGFGILGQALSRAAGEPYIDYVQRHILTPLEMKHSAFEQNDEILKGLAKGYIIRNGLADASDSTRELRTGRGYKIPNGALFTTVGDLAKFVSLEMGDGPESVISRSVLADNYTRVASANGDLSFGYGAGFMMRREGETIAIGHGGSVAGFVAGAWFNPTSHTGVIFLRNAAGRGFRDDAVMAAIQALSK